MRRVVVTGVNRGLGLEFTRQLLAAGDEVVATVRQPKKADDLHKLVTTSGGRGTVIRLDVLQVNAVGPVLVTQALAPLLAAARGAIVVNLSSGLGSLERATARGNV